MRELIKNILMISAFCCATVLHAEVFVEGKDYVRVNAPTPTPGAGPTLVEFFSYGCPACAHLEPALATWLTAHPQAHFSRIPTVFHPEWIGYAKAYYVADALHLLPAANETLFQAVHQHVPPVHTEAEMMQFFEQHFHLSAAAVEAAFLKDPALHLKISAGMMQAGHFEIKYIPAFVVNQAYETDLSQAKSLPRLLEILDFLLKKPVEPQQKETPHV